MSGETLEDYFRRLYLDESRRAYLENIKEVDKEIEEQHFKNRIGRQHSLIAEDRYSMYMKRFAIHRHPNRAPFTRYSWDGTS